MKLTENVRGWIWASLGTIAVLVLVPLLLYLVRLETARPKYYTPNAWLDEVREVIQNGIASETSEESLRAAWKTEDLINHMPKKSKVAWWDFRVWPSRTAELDMFQLSEENLRPFAKKMRDQAKMLEAQELIDQAGVDIEQAKELPVEEAQMKMFDGLKKLDQALQNLGELGHSCQQATTTAP